VPLAAKRVGFALVDANSRNARASFEQLKMVSTVAQNAGLRLEVVLLTLGEDDAGQRIEQLASGVDALMLYGYVDLALLDRLARFTIPRVFLGNILGDENHPAPEAPTGWHAVTAEPTRMGHVAATLLLQAGHRRIGFVGERAALGMWSDRWRHGFRYAHTDAGLTADAALLQITDAGRSADHFAGMKNAPTAYAIVDASLAEDFLRAMQKRGRPVAKNAIVIGGNPDSLTAANMQAAPALVQRIPPLIKASVELLHQLLAGRDFPCSRIVLPFETQNLDAISRI
jgi:DNA-binding LacI/PurR family transcriptional regulator